MLLKLNSNGNDVLRWQQYLKSQGYNINPDGIFGKNTEDATKDFQKKNNLVADGMVGNITFGYVSALKSPVPNKIKTERDLLLWIKDNLGGIIDIAIEGTNYTEDWLGAIACRETGFLLVKYINRGYSFQKLCYNMKGDYRNGIYNGFGIWQVDIKSYPTFINSGDWRDPLKTAKKAVSVLDEKANYLNKYFTTTFGNINFERAVTSAYNTGQGNVERSIKLNRDVDYTTFNKDYSKEVFRMREKYKTL